MPACTASLLPRLHLVLPGEDGQLFTPAPDPLHRHRLCQPNPHPLEHPTFWLPKPAWLRPCAGDETSSLTAKGSPELGRGGMDVTLGHHFCPHGYAPARSISLSCTAPTAAPKLLVTNTSSFKKPQAFLAPVPQDLLICKTQRAASLWGHQGILQHERYLRCPSQEGQRCLRILSVNNFDLQNTLFQHLPPISPGGKSRL